MNTKTRRTLALFAATALTVGSLVACAPQASTSKDSQTTESGATSQSSKSSSSTQTEQKPVESASSTTSSSSGTSQTEQADATPTNTTSSATSSEAAPSQVGVTGWLIGVCVDGSSDANPAVTSVALSNGTLTIEGAMAYSESEPKTIPTDRSTWVSGPMTFSVNESTKWQGRGGEAGTVDIDSEQLIQVVNSHNGLGLVIQAENGTVRSITLAS